MRGIVAIWALVVTPAAVAQSYPISVTGVMSGVGANNGQRPARQDINDLYSRGGPPW